MTKQPNVRQRLRRRLTEGGIIIAPGIYDAYGARFVEQAGFEAVYMTGNGVSASLLGQPDVGLVDLTLITAHAHRVASCVELPLICDADTGYGNAVNVRHTVREFEAAGVAAIHLEDQVLPKRCGQLPGARPVVEFAEAVGKIEAVVAARLDPDFVIIARTDARHVTGMTDAIERANAYRAAGADAIFPEGLQSEAEFAEFAKGSPGPLLANMTEFGKTPDIPVSRFGELGYSIVIHPLTVMRVAMGSVTSALERLRKDGSAASLLPQMQTRQQLYDLLGYKPGRAWTFPRG